jgi:hypothetical protein
VLVHVAVCEGVGVTVLVCVAVGVAVAAGVTLGVLIGVPVNVAVAVGVVVGVTVGVDEAVAVAVGISVAVSDGVAVGIATPPCNTSGRYRLHPPPSKAMMSTSTIAGTCSSWSKPGCAWENDAPPIPSAGGGPDEAADQL